MTQPAGTRRRAAPGRALDSALAAIVAWGAFAFGAVYPWAYVPLALAAVAAGLLGLLLSRGHGTHISRGLAMALALLGVAIAAQLLPLSRDALAAISPETVRVLHEINPVFANVAGTPHPTSIDPALTRTALLLFLSLATLLAGATRWFSIRGASVFATALAILGVAMAVTGVVQRALFNGRIYGFWLPESWKGDVRGDAFGPFVNKHHFAGWMVMALAVTLGLLCARLWSPRPDAVRGWRDRVLRLSSPETGQAVLLGGAALAMTVTLALTMSRSGIVAMAFAFGVMILFVVSGRGGGWRKVAAVAVVSAVLLGALVWVGESQIARHFANADWITLNDRRGAARDAWSIAQMFPLTGTGLNTYGVATLLFQTHALDLHYAQAHNDYLQVGAEGGLLIGVPALLCLGIMARDVRRRFADDRGTPAYWLRAGAVAAIAGIGLQEAFDFSLQMPGNAALFALVCGMALHRTPVRAARPRGASKRHD